MLDEILICLIRATFDHLVEALEAVCEVRLATDFEFDCEEENLGEGAWNKRLRVKQWRLYNLEQRQREEDQKWLDSFEGVYGLSPRDFISAYEQAINVPRRAPHNYAKHLAVDLKRRGLEMTAAEVKKIHDRLQQYHWLWPQVLSPTSK